MADDSPYSGLYDTLASDSSVRLFGRLMWDIVLKEPASERIKPYGDNLKTSPIPRRLSKNNFIFEQLSDENAKLARIVAFSYQNQLFDMARPAIFLVHGDGEDVEFIDEGASSLETMFVHRIPTFADRSGVVSQQSSFAPNIRVWLYDRADFTVRLDSDTGTFEHLLLGAELGPIRSGSMGSGDGDDPPPPPPPPRRRRWRGSGD